MASDDPDEAPKRLSSDESLWDPDPAEPRPRRGLLRVDLLITVAAVVLLLVGFLLGVAVTRAGTEEPRPVAQTAAPAPSTSIPVRPGPPPRECLIAMERADAAIAYLVGNIRDQRLSDTIQEFVDARACASAGRGCPPASSSSCWSATSPTARSWVASPRRS